MNTGDGGVCSKSTHPRPLCFVEFVHLEREGFAKKGKISQNVLKKQHKVLYFLRGL